MGASFEEPRCFAAGVLSARHLYRRHPGGAGRAPGSGRVKKVSPGEISRLTASWEGEHDAWRRTDRSDWRHVYVWADSDSLQARLESQSECILVTTGATPHREKELAGF